MIKITEDFLIEIKFLIEKTGSEEIKNYREKFSELTKNLQKRQKNAN